MRLPPGPGQRQDIALAHELVVGLTPGAVIADRGHDADPLREAIDKAGAGPVIPARANRTQPGPHDKALHKERNPIGRFSCRLERLRRVATRHDKLLANDQGLVQLAATTILLQ